MGNVCCKKGEEVLDWADFSLDERKPIMKAMAAKLQEHEVADWCKVKSFDQFVGSLTSGKMYTKSSLIIEGIYYIENEDKIETLKADLAIAS